MLNQRAPRSITDIPEKQRPLLFPAGAAPL